MLLKRTGSFGNLESWSKTIFGIRGLSHDEKLEIRMNRPGMFEFLLAPVPAVPWPVTEKTLVDKVGGIEVPFLSFAG